MQNSQSIEPKIKTIFEKYLTLKNTPIDQLKSMYLDIKSKNNSHETLKDDDLSEIFAIGIEIIRLNTNLTLFKSQVEGSIILNKNAIAELKTGEGKTLTAVLAAIASALNGTVHIVTVNDYLAHRDYKLLKPIYESLGLKVGLVTSTTTTYKKREAYDSDIVYVTNSELGFDYLRDNMVLKISDRVILRPFYHAIIDEVDSILIDEAKTPLIISSAAKIVPERYLHADSIVKKLIPEDYKIDQTSRTITLTKSGRNKISKQLNVENIYSHESVDQMHFIFQALQANFIQRDGIEYLIKNNEIQLIDASTGRVMIGRRYSEGLMQAIEAKEGVVIQPETETAASITYQNLFRLYPRLSGMTGTAYTEREEFQSIYKLKVYQVKTNKPIKRKDLIDMVYIDQNYRNSAVVDKIIKLHKLHQPILVAAENVALSETISGLLNVKNINHKLLTARDAADEAQIISKAGEYDSITITTNMSGRGTDIQLTPETSNTGLFVLGVGRNESERVDNQLRGRAGRQGDPGASQFFVALDDDLLTRLELDEVSKIFNKLSPNTPSEIGSKFKLVHHFFTRAQKITEGRNYDTRKNTLEYDDVLREQRTIMYNMRNKLLNSIEIDPSSTIKTMIVKVNQYKKNNKIKHHINENKIFKKIKDKKVDTSQYTEIALTILDKNWSNHMTILDSLRASVSYRSYAQTNPLIDYQLEAIDLYNKFLYDTRVEILESIENFTNTVTMKSEKLKAIESSNLKTLRN